MTQRESILRALRAGPATVQDLVTDTGLDRRAVSAYLSVLVREGAVKRTGVELRGERQSGPCSGIYALDGMPESTGTETFVGHVSHFQQNGVRMPVAVVFSASLRLPIPVIRHGCFEHVAPDGSRVRGVRAPEIAASRVRRFMA